MFLKSILPVQIITAEELDKRIASAILMVADKIGPKVMQLDNGNIINRSEMRKFGFKVAELVATMRPTTA